MVSSADLTVNGKVTAVNAVGVKVTGGTATIHGLTEASGETTGDDRGKGLVATGGELTALGGILVGGNAMGVEASGGAKVYLSSADIK
ncbi:hypothetical protein LJC40_06055, partial [Synergistaceae bacterium OttesenSCG-928-D05]|nr:hypothetical protein [Synergistaceae bacterium OttesenSCG-928-D05]